MSPISVARETIGSQMASQKYVSKFYKNGTTAKGVLTVPGVTLKPEAKKIVREEWEKMKDLHEKQLISVFSLGFDI